ncbi:MAG: tetratricopeptide repeat protein [Nitrospirae bacterium]|nr:tetratricopeptide repeat protein [Nitrospirota bacterium]
MKCRRAWIVLVLFVLLGTAVYWNSLGNSFHYDDQMSIELNENIRSLINIPEFFADPKTQSGSPYEAGHYRPLVVMSFAVNYAIGALNPSGYHYFNLILHIGSAFLLFLIVNTIMGGSELAEVKLLWKGVSPLIDSRRFLAAVSAGFIFLLHPFNSEAINYVTARSSVLSGFFYLLAFYCWVKYRSQKLEVSNKLIYVFYLCSLLAFVAGMLSKEVAVTLPVMLWLYDLYGFQQAPRKQASAFAYIVDWRNYLPYLPFVLIVVVPYLLIRLLSYGVVLDPFKRKIFPQLMTELPVLIQHWKMFLIPTGLTPIHDVRIYSTFWSFPVAISAIVLICYVVIAIYLLYSSYSWRVVSFFMFWFFIVLLPTTIIPLNTIFQENRGYLAAVSFAVLAGVAIAKVSRNSLEKAGIAFLVILVALYSVAIVKRNSVWKDDLTLWTDTVQKAPESPLAYTALGVAYKGHGLYNDAVAAFQKALALGGQNNFIVHDSMAKIHMINKRWDMAAVEFEKALKAFYYKAQTHHDLGVCYYRINNLDLAEKHFREAARLDPKYYLAYVNLGILYSNKGMREDAVLAYQKAIALYPDMLLAQLNLGILQEEMGMTSDAVEHYRIVLGKAGKDDDIAREARNRLKRLETLYSN